MLREIKPGRKSFIINIDEPYAKDIFEILNKGQMKNGEWPEGDITFHELQAQTFQLKRKED